MQRSDFPRFRELMAGMAKLYERELDAPVLDAYWLALADWSLEEFERAAAHLMATSAFMPRPAHFTALRKAETPTAGEAWARVLEHVKGAYRDGSGIDRGGPIDQAARGLGGYRVIAFYDTAYLGALERRFAEYYATANDITEQRSVLPPPRALKELAHG